MFGSQLKKLRNGIGLSQATLARKLSVSQQTVASWEVDRSSPSPEMLSLISDVFAVSVDYLLGKTDEKRPAAETGDEPSPMFDGLPLTKDETRLLSQYRSLNRQGKEYILQTLDMAVNVYKKEVSVSDVEAADVG